MWNHVWESVREYVWPVLFVVMPLIALYIGFDCWKTVYRVWKTEDRYYLRVTVVFGIVYTTLCPFLGWCLYLMWENQDQEIVPLALAAVIFIFVLISFFTRWNSHDTHHQI